MRIFDWDTITLILVSSSVNSYILHCENVMYHNFGSSNIARNFQCSIQNKQHICEYFCFSFIVQYQSSQFRYHHIFGSSASYDKNPMNLSSLCFNSK